MEAVEKQKGVSVIIPVYNAEKYLDKCLDSLIKQSFQDFEAIIVNDGSTDNSQTILEKYEKAYPDRFKVFEKENGGQSSARNLALHHIEGKYVTFLDSDDYYDKEYLKTLYQAAEENNSDMVLSGQNKVDEQGAVLERIEYKENKKGECILRRLNFSGKLYKTEFLKRHNMKFAEGKIYEDNPFNFVMIGLAENLVVLPYVGYNQVVHKGSTTTKQISEDKLPYNEIEYALKYVVKNQTQANDPKIFEYTVLSFFTYFIFKANKQHMYLDLEGRKSNQDVIEHLCEFVLTNLKREFPRYWKNPYIRLFRNGELQLSQRVGVIAFVFLCKTKLLKTFAKVYYKF